MDRPLFSVITVTRNNLDGLRATCDSVRNQQFGGVQHVVVDGLSSDGTDQYLRDLRSVVSVSEADSGIYDAMNKGAAMSTGRFLLFLNAGDVFYDDHVLARVEPVLSEPGVVWATGISRMLDHAGRPVRLHMNVPFKRRRFVSGVKSLPHQATFVGADQFAELGGYDLSYGIAADQELLYRLLLRAAPVSLFEIVADCDGGGVSSTRLPSTFVSEMHEIRAAHGQAVVGSPVADRALSAMLRAPLDVFYRLR